MRKDALRNRELLIASAREIFAQRGFDASLDDVAHHAGLGVGTAYRHFANKRELASAIIDQAIDRIAVLAETALEVDDPWDALVGFMTGALEVQAADRGLRELLAGTHDPEKFDQIHDRLSGLIDRLVKRGQKARVVRTDLQTSDIGFVMTMVGAVADMGGDTAPEIWRRYLAMCLEGFRPSAAKAPVAALAEGDFRKTMAAHHDLIAR
jgi:AcrR family transcriptional regulator